jgi:hypothetical protein
MIWNAPKLWDNTDCWIICGGSSISEQFRIPKKTIPETKEEFVAYGDYMSAIHEKRVIGVNLSVFLGDWVDVGYWGDSKPYTEYKSWFDRYSGLKVSSAGKFSDKNFPEIKYLHKTGTEGITKERDKISWVNGNSGSSAINLAVHLGASRVFLLGLDMYHHKAGRMHFHSGYPDKLKTPNISQIKAGVHHERMRPLTSFDRQNRNWELISDDAKKQGIEIINVNPKSGVTAFKKMSLKKALVYGGTDETV